MPDPPGHPPGRNATADERRRLAEDLAVLVLLRLRRADDRPVEPPPLGASDRPTPAHEPTGDSTRPPAARAGGRMGPEGENRVPRS